MNYYYKLPMLFILVLIVTNYRVDVYISLVIFKVLLVKICFKYKLYLCIISNLFIIIQTHVKIELAT